MRIGVENHRNLIAEVRKRPGMWLIRPDFASVVAFVTGCDEANASLLTGFREWLVTQVGSGDNHVWWSLVAHLTEPAGPKNFHQMEPALDTRAVETLFDLLDEFLELRQERDGLRRIYAAYERWHQQSDQPDCGATAEPSHPNVAWPRASSRTNSAS
ncbi:hypothetical protein [Catellatospora paridis]|uniref:hypothetical protein n=1 Tax=Catellatospora paridis TaxID=1617086 RepID=UPI0012D42216|nr:hypothetical protein [Catellatospora paridis]